MNNNMILLMKFVTPEIILSVFILFIILYVINKIIKFSLEPKYKTHDDTETKLHKIYVYIKKSIIKDITPLCNILFYPIKQNKWFLTIFFIISLIVFGILKLEDVLTIISAF